MLLLAKTIMKNYFLLLIFISFSGYTQISTDRPDQTESSLVLSKNKLQIESGISFEDDKIINTLFRFGLSDRVEIRLNTNYIFKDSNDVKNTPSSNFGDIEIGTKIQLLDIIDINTKVAFLTHISLPSSSGYYSNHEYGTLNRILISHDLSQTLSIGYNLGYNKVSGVPGSIIYTLALAKSIGSWSIYAELFGENSKKESPNNFDIGLTYLIRDNIQSDVSFGKGFNNDFNYFAVGISWSYDLAK